MQLGIGTAQFGIDYGISRSEGKSLWQIFRDLKAENRSENDHNVIFPMHFHYRISRYDKNSCPVKFDAYKRV